MEPSHNDAPVKDLDYWEENFTFLDPDLAGGRWVDVVNGLRERCPVGRSMAHVDDDDERGFTYLMKYEDILFAHNNPEIYSSCPVTMPTAGLARPWIPIESDPPLHKKYRSILNAMFTKRSQEAKADEYRAVASGMLDAIVAKGEADLYKEYCMPLPSHVIMDAFDIPLADRAHVEKQMMLFIHRPGALDDPTETARIVQAAAIELNVYLGGLVTARKQAPGDDIISTLVTSEIDGRPLSDSEIVDYSMLLIPAGFETTGFTLSFILRDLDLNPDVRQCLIDDPSLIPSAIEEIMRLETPTRALARTVMVDHEVSDGTTLKRGDRVLLVWASADRDPDVFENPNDLVIDRSPNRHFGFGWGAHLCAGIHMARVEMRVAIEELLTRIPDYRITSYDEVLEKPGMTWTVSALPATWDAEAAVARTS
jgi:cytochrome P450